MKLTDDQMKSIEEETLQWKEKLYANKTLEERKSLGQFFTPVEIVIQMLDKFDDFNVTILDPCCGAGILLAAAIKVGFKPENIYGIEIDKDIIEVAKSRLLPFGVPDKNIHLGDALNSESYNL